MSKKKGFVYSGKKLVVPLAEHKILISDVFEAVASWSNLNQKFRQKQRAGNWILFDSVHICVSIQWLLQSRYRHRLKENCPRLHSALCDSRTEQTTLGLTKHAIEFLNVVEPQAKRYLPGGELGNLKPESVIFDARFIQGTYCSGHSLWWQWLGFIRVASYRVGW